MGVGGEGVGIKLGMKVCKVFEFSPAKIVDEGGISLVLLQLYIVCLSRH